MGSTLTTATVSLCSRNVIEPPSVEKVSTVGFIVYLMGSMQEYDIVVIGSGPGGQKAAIASAKLGKSVAHHRARPNARRRLRQHRHDPVKDVARGGAFTSPG